MMFRISVGEDENECMYVAVRDPYSEKLRCIITADFYADETNDVAKREDIIIETPRGTWRVKPSGEVVLDPEWIQGDWPA
jgi:hypothetical protein